MFQTERFVRDEVLQLICDRLQAITQADSIAIAITEGAALVCRATAGPLPIPRGIRLIGESEFLQECLESGKILRCDDADTDVRVELDFSRQMGARSTVLVPLRGRRENIGVLQALSINPWAFTDNDIRSFDLFAELVLSALKPEDQDRRLHWLSDVAGELLQAKAVVEAPVAEINTVSLPVFASVQVESMGIEPAPIEPTKAETLELAPPQPEVTPIAPVIAELPVAEKPAALENLRFTDLDEMAPIVIPVASVELPEAPFADREFSFGHELGETPEESVPSPSLSFLHRITLPGSSRPGLSVVMGLVALAALFSAGVWWGMQAHEKAGTTKIAASPRSVTAPAAPAAEVIAPAVSDNLMDPGQAAPKDAPLTPVTDSKLATLPKITGVRHWSSSMGSTVVIDMQDQVNYEVHRLMSPERIYFDLHDTALVPDLDGKTMDVGDTSLTKVRVAQPVAGVTRIVLDTKDGSNFSVSMESNPYRLVVELRDNVKAASLRPVPAPAKPEQAAELASKSAGPPLPARTGKFRIVLDAGHGGWDLGTVGRQGLLEKDLVLDVTKRLGKLLQARLGSEVMFTRRGDEYLPLDQRADYANQAQADLFVSVHANYSNSATARGVETYYTNLFAAPGSKEIEKHADGTFNQPSPVSLSAGGLQEKIEESRRLAASVQRSLFGTLSSKSPDIRDRGIKAAGFAVLTGTTMPAILTEISFVSSPADEHNLQSEAYRQQIAEALYKGIARYEEASPRVKVAQLRPASTRP